MLRVLSLLDNDRSTLLVPEAKPRDTNNMRFYYFYVAYALESLSNVVIMTQPMARLLLLLATCGCSTIIYFS